MRDRFDGWPMETTGTGHSNVAYPDTDATYWTMPFDRSRWKAIVVTGTYPAARFMSFTTYNAHGDAVDSAFDYAIKPDRHSVNPFTPGQAGLGSPPRHVFGQTYTVTVSADAGAARGGGTVLGVADSRLGWLVYRIYVPDKGLDRQAGVTSTSPRRISASSRAA